MTISSNCNCKFIIQTASFKQTAYHTATKKTASFKQTAYHTATKKTASFKQTAYHTATKKTASFKQTAYHTATKKTNPKLFNASNTEFFFFLLTHTPSFVASRIISDGSCKYNTIKPIKWYLNVQNSFSLIYC